MARQLLGEGGEFAARLAEAGESTTSGRPPRRPAGTASTYELVRVRLRMSSGTPVIPPSVSSASDSAGVMYRARGPVGRWAGYHSDTISSRCRSGTQGSWRAVSTRCSEVLPTGSRPVGGGRNGVPVEVPDRSTAVRVVVDAVADGEPRPTATAVTSTPTATGAPRGLRRRGPSG
ncbi:hypothetical protein [Micromonospora zhanjiangensis]